MVSRKTVSTVAINRVTTTCAASLHTCHREVGNLSTAVDAEQNAFLSCWRWVYKAATKRLTNDRQVVDRDVNRCCLSIDTRSHKHNVTCISRCHSSFDGLHGVDDSVTIVVVIAVSLVNPDHSWLGNKCATRGDTDPVTTTPDRQCLITTVGVPQFTNSPVSAARSCVLIKNIMTTLNSTNRCKYVINTCPRRSTSVLLSSSNDVKTFDLVNVNSVVSQLCTVDRTISDLTVGDRVSSKLRLCDCIIQNLGCCNSVSSKLTFSYCKVIDFCSLY